MPVFNGADYCRAALSDLQAQTLRNLEIIVIDDGSTDNTAHLLRAQAAGDSRIQLLLQDHRGIVAALKNGMEACRGRFVARMDADDRCASKRLQCQLDWLHGNPGAGAVDCKAELLASTITGGGMRRYIEWINDLHDWSRIRDSLFEESPLVHPAVMMRRDAYDAAGGYLEDDYAEDYSLWLRMVGAGFSLGKVQQTLFSWSDLPNRLTRTDTRYSLAQMMALKAGCLLDIEPDIRRGVCLWGAGVTGRRFGRELLKHGVHIACYYDIDPRKIGRVRHGRPIRNLKDIHVQQEKYCLVALGSRPAKAVARKFIAQHASLKHLQFVFIS
jgi:hypothetical protein